MNFKKYFFIFWRCSFRDISGLREPIYSDGIGTRPDVTVHWNGGSGGGRCSTPTNDLDQWKWWVGISWVKNKCWSLKINLEMVSTWFWAMKTMRWQLLMSISWTLNARVFCTNVISAAFSSYMLKKLPKRRLYEKAAHRTLMKLSPIVKITNILFMSSFCADILSPKDYKAELYKEKSCVKHFCTKGWWNWNLRDK